MPAKMVEGSQMELEFGTRTIPLIVEKRYNDRVLRVRQDTAVSLLALPLPFFSKSFPEWFLPRTFIVKTTRGPEWYDGKRKGKPPTVTLDEEINTYAVLETLQEICIPRLYGTAILVLPSCERKEALVIQYIRPAYSWPTECPQKQLMALGIYQCYAQLSEHNVGYPDSKLEHIVVTEEPDRTIYAGTAIWSLAIICVWLGSVKGGMPVQLITFVTVPLVLFSYYRLRSLRTSPRVKIFLIDLEWVELDKDHSQTTTTMIATARGLIDDVGGNWQEIERLMTERGDFSMRTYQIGRESNREKHRIARENAPKFRW